jgi:hypothetical protein
MVDWSLGLWRKNVGMVGRVSLRQRKRGETDWIMGILLYRETCNARKGNIEIKIKTE